jgi:filamentous hemagglutinin family protein
MSWRLRTLLLATTALAPLAAAPVGANPLGAQVVGGSATVQGQGTPTVTVTQQSNSAIINWNTFNIGAGETTKIIQPSASSVELDRVTGGLGPSQIFGSLFSNGQVFVVNPDGILIGPGGKIDTAAFLATTHDISNSDFMAGRYNFNGPGNSAASIVNQGAITAEIGGFAALVAPGVRNTGTITAKLGQIGLASANGFSLDFYGDSLITLGVNDSIAATVIDVSTGKPLSALVSNEGTLKANGGRVELTAVAARKVVDSVINNTGVIEANTIGTHNGMIVLGAATGASKPAGAPTQTVKVSGKVSAASTRKGTTGGTIEVAGENIQVSGAKIDASGQAGGGTVLIGGDWGGGNPNTTLVSNPSAYLQPYTVPIATTASVDAATVINASATDAGDGGKVIVWSDEATTFYGTIIARGGAQAGDGGFVETSGHTLQVGGALIDTSALSGRTGLWFLDPYDLTIDSAAASTISTSLSNSNVTVETTATSYSGPGNASPGSGNITVDASMSWNSNNTLTLSAYNDVALVGPAVIANLAGGNLVLRADNSGTGAGSVLFIPTFPGICMGFSCVVYVPKIDFSGSTGKVSIYYDSSDNPAGSGVNPTSYTGPTDYSSSVLTNGSVPNQLTAYMLVNTVYDLQNIQNNLGGRFALGKDIDASATTGWNGGAGFSPIGADNTDPFVGKFEGDNHVISNLTINSYQANVGLFGYVSGSVADVGLVNETVNSLLTNGPSNVGGLAGFSSGNITNAYVSGNITSDYLVGMVGYGISSEVGGLVGANAGLISSSYTTGNVGGQTTTAVGGLVGINCDCFGTPTNALIESSYSSATVTGGLGSFGGLVGMNISDGAISKSYASGSVTGGDNSDVGGFVGNAASGDITQSYALGSVIGGASSRVGGFVGWNSGGGLISQSYARGSAVGGDNSYVGGFVGENFFSCTGCNPPTISESYSTGAATAGASALVGGFVGYSPNNGPYSAIVVNSYWDVAASLNMASEGGVGLTTAELKSGLPNGFDPTVWGSSPTINGGYPYLLWQVASVSPVPTTTYMPTQTSSTETVTSSPLAYQTGQININFVQPATINTTVAGSTPSVINNLNTALNSPSYISLNTSNLIPNTNLWTGTPGPISPNQLLNKMQPLIGAIDSLWKNVPPTQNWTSFMSDAEIELGKLVGFQAGVYITNGQPTLVFQSTNSIRDFVFTDAVNAIFSKLGIPTGTNPQYWLAAQLAAQVAKDYPSQNLTLTGFSLGGGLAAYAGATDKIPAVTFDPAGISNEASYNSSYVLNFQMTGDIAQTGGSLIGTTIFFDPALAAKASLIDTPFVGGALRHIAEGVDVFNFVSSIQNLKITGTTNAGNGSAVYTIGQ